MEQLSQWSQDVEMQKRSPTDDYISQDSTHKSFI
jgi:hypothetical protein